MIIEQLQEKAGFSPIECSVADLFLEEGEGLRNQSARSIAAKLYTAPSTIALTSYGRSILADSVDVTLCASTREKLVDKIGCFAMSVSTLFVLDVIYSCILALDYEANLERRITVSRGYEQYRDSSNPILRDRA